MTIQDWGSIGELVGAVAVVVSLLYLAIQVRQNTASERSATVSAIAQSMAEFTSQLGQDPALVRLHVRGLAEAKLDTEERIQWDFQMLSMMRKMENAFAQRQLGIVKEEEWKDWGPPILGVLLSPGGQRWWGEWQSFINEEFRAHVNQQMEDGSLTGLPPDHPITRAIRELGEG